MGRKTKLTPEVQQIIVDAIKDGAFDWVAAEAAGITPQTFYNWLARGEQNKRAPYFEFFEEVGKARAAARRQAETTVFKENPLAWLRYGPGKTKPGADGWTERVEHTGADGGEIVVKVVYGADGKSTDAAS